MVRRRHIVVGVVIVGAFLAAGATALQPVTTQVPSAFEARKLPVAASFSPCRATETFQPGREVLLDRAILSPDGSNLVLYCQHDGAGGAYAYRRGKTERLTPGSLFQAAQAKGILRHDITCPASVDDKTDCDVLDRVGDVYALNWGGDLHIVRAGQSRPLASPDYTISGGVLWPRGGANEMIVVDQDMKPSVLRSMSLAGAPGRELARFASLNMVFEDGAPDPTSLRYGAAADVVLVEYTGVFRVAGEMTVLSAYTPQGQKRWSIVGELPKRTDDNLIAGDTTRIHVFDKGRFGALVRTATPDRTEIIDLSSGKPVDALQGAVIGASSEARALLVRLTPNEIGFVFWQRPGS